MLEQKGNVIYKDGLPFAVLNTPEDAQNVLMKLRGNNLQRAADSLARVLQYVTKQAGHHLSRVNVIERLERDALDLDDDDYRSENHFAHLVKSITE